MKILKSIFIPVFLFPLILLGCSQSDVFENIIEYPAAIEDQEHEAKLFGLTFGKVRRVVTDDSYEEVLAYYRKVLEPYNPEVIPHALEDGHQAAITITGDYSITIAIQEFKKEGKTSITYMN